MKKFKLQDYASIQEAVNACGRAGGGKVIIPCGEWRSEGPIHLMSNTELHLEDGAVVIFSDRYEDYLPVVFTRWEGMECYNYSPLIYANGCENISITGKGTLIGSGQAWWPWKKLQAQAAEELCYSERNGIPVEKRIYGTEAAALRPSFIQPVSCRNVLMEGFTIIDGPQWTIHPVYCENVTVRNVTVSTHGPNTDGLNPDSCRDVLIEGCTFDTGDDCIAINSGMNEDGWRVGKPCENIEIRNCVMNGGHGGLVIGSGMSGGVKNVFAHDCRIAGTMRGIRIKSMRGRGGYVKDVRFENLEINDTEDQAIQITMFYDATTVEPKADTPSDFSNIVIRGVKGKGLKAGIQLAGLPEHRMSHITLEDIELVAESAMECVDVENLTMKNVRITSPEDMSGERGTEK